LKLVNARSSRKRIERSRDGRASDAGVVADLACRVVIRRRHHGAARLLKLVTPEGIAAISAAKLSSASLTLAPATPESLAICEAR